MSIITECDNCGQRKKYLPGNTDVPYGHDGAIQWSVGSSEIKAYMLVKEFTCEDCKTGADRKAEEARAAALLARRQEPIPPEPLRSKGDEA